MSLTIKDTIWWRCDNGHEWEATIDSRTRKNSSCPFCAGKRPTPENNLAVKYPEVTTEWNSSKNGKLQPTEVLSKSHRKVWWKCNKHGHEWKTMISNRTQNGSGCPYCSRNLPSLNYNLVTKFPEIAAEWHPLKNDKIPVCFTPYSNKKVWWKCDNGHEWEAIINNRTRGGTGCPVCFKIKHH